MEMKFGPVTFIGGLNSGKYPCCHSLYIEADRKVLIDPASDRERLQQIAAGPGVDLVWLSHYHEDHFKDLDLFEESDLWISEWDASALKDLEHFFDAYGMNSFERRMWQQPMIDEFHFKPRRPARLFRDEETVDLGGVTVTVIPTPGHTPGHCSLYFPELEILFLGDYDLAAFGPWYGDKESDIEQTIASVTRLRSISARVWIASHEKGVFESEPDGLWDAYLAVIDRREAKLLDFLRAPRTMDDIIEARILYGRKREPKEFYDFGERAHMGKHLERLMGRGSVVFDGGVYCRSA